MTITSIYYLAFVALGAFVYYLAPKLEQWVVMLILSIVFYFLMASPVTIFYLVGATAVAYIATGFLINKRAETERGKRIAVSILSIAIILNILVWFVIKGDLLLVSVNLVIRKVFTGLPEFRGFSFVAPLGMGYYTLQVIGYILDCTWEVATPQKNPLKLFLFVCFFPQLTTGPINRYSQLVCLYEKHRFSYKNLAFGAQRILWGIFKKIVIAERVSMIVNGIWENLDIYSGYYHWVALLLYPIQMYADFSGCMDIVLGTAEIFDIHMPENFNNPFFSRTSQEFWQRWHITLGGWAKDYVLYPLLKSKPMIRFSKFTKKKFGKQYGKFIATSVGMLCLWMVMGIWHGASKYIVGVSLWYWIILMLGDLMAPLFVCVNRMLSIPEESFGWHFFQSVRTYLIYAVGAVFFRALNMSEALDFIKSLFSMFLSEKNGKNPWIFFDGSVLKLGITHIDLNVIIIGILFLIVVGGLREKYGYAREWMQKQFIVFRWIIWISLFVLILVYGKYGPGYSAAEFIYKGF